MPSSSFLHPAQARPGRTNSVLRLVLVDYTNPRQARDLVELLDSYARDPAGGGEGLAEAVKRQLPSALAQRPDAFSVIAYMDDKPAGLINCFEGFSTFACKPLVNIHDVVVRPEFRGLKISHRMLEKVEELAKNRGACKLTLEVVEGNTPARKSYEKYGFAPYELDPSMGKALFWEKKIT